MNANKRLIIPIKGLREGWHNFIYKINDKFFEALEYSELKKGNLSLDVYLYKNSQNLLLKYLISGTVYVMCDRCLDYFDMKVESNGEFYIKFADKKEDNDEGSITIAPNEDIVDITHYIYESLILNLPSKLVHPLTNKGKSTCNSEMIKKLEIINKQKNRNKEIDSRWEKLKRIYN